jgi:hypothetical protein
MALGLAAAAGAIEPRAPAPSPTFFYHVAGDEPGPWPEIFSSLGLSPGAAGAEGIFVMRTGEANLEPQWRERVQQGALLVLEGDSGIAAAFGFRPTERRVPTRNVVDRHAPQLGIIWERQLELPVFETPPGATVFAKERWSGAPLAAGFRHGAGGVLWLAVTPGEHGHERFPYLFHALGELGFSPPFRSRRLWAFFDPPYRSRVDLDYFAQRWRRAGIAALHVSAWHYFEPDAERDAWLRRLIEACHRQAIQIYAWLELPHVSEAFWNAHPQWREKTAVLQDAFLDWRKLMNLANRDCHAAVAAGIQQLIDRFDWDGVNLAELYFESLEGHSNPARFTPMNEDVRREFQALAGFDPLELFQAGSPRHFEKNAAGLRQFLDFRAQLARRMQEEWIEEIERARRRKPHLDLVLTHVDDRFDTRMRDLIGADAAALLPLLDRHNFTFLIEDPATVWHLGPKRYPEIATRYEPLTPHAEKLAIDINIVERYQDVYPTRQQTGIELYQQLHLASKAFARVALYAEHSILRADLPLLPSAASAVGRVARVEDKLAVESRFGVGVPWRGPAKVDGRLWPAACDEAVWLPGGAHAIQPAQEAPPLRLLDLNAELKTAAVTEHGIEFAYESASRAMAVLDTLPGRVEIDGQVADVRTVEAGGRYVLLLPRGQHVVGVEAAPRAVARAGAD